VRGGRGGDGETGKGGEEKRSRSAFRDEQHGEERDGDMLYCM
jgi:hypothetical protein